MKKGKVFAIILLALAMLTSFVSCNSEVAVEEVGQASINFAPAINKALNQKGEENLAVTKSVEAYYWDYYCSLDKPQRTDGNFDLLDWKAFDDIPSTQKGLGKINSLVKGESYYFGLRGYSDEDREDLVWEGFHYSEGNAGETSDAFEKVKLTSKNQLITVDVYTAGVGRLFFNFTAPAVNGFGVDDESAVNFRLNGELQYDYFTYTLSSLDGSNATTPTNLIVSGEGTAVVGTNYGYYTSSTDEFTYSDISGEGADLPAGTYLMTIWQNNFNRSATDSDHPFGQYKAVNQRKQVLIVNIIPGLNTVIAGSLDSTSLDTFDYDANLNLEVIFHQSDVSKVTPLKVTVTNSASPAQTKVVYDNSRIKVANGDYVTLSWTSNTDVNVFVNGDLVCLDRTDTRDDFGSNIAFYVRQDNTIYTYLSDIYLAPAGSDCSIKAYGKDGTDYIVTIESIAEDIEDSESKSFTIVGIGDDAAIKAVNTAVTEASLKSGSDAITLETDASENTTVTANVSKSAALEILESMDGYTTATDNKLTLTLSVLETDKTENEVSYEIDLNASAYLSGLTTESKTRTASVKTLSDYVTATMQIDKGLSVLHVYHSNGSTKYEMTSVEDISAAVTEENKGTESDPFYVGVYHYDAETGVLTIKTRSFSPFEVEFTPCVAAIGDTRYGTLESAVKGASDGDTIKLLTDTTSGRIKLGTTGYDKSVTLDLNGKVLTSNAAYNVAFSVENGRTLTIDGTTSGSKIKGTVMISNSKRIGHVVVDGGTYENDLYTPFYINGDCGDGCTLTISDATIKGTRSASADQPEAGHGLYLAGRCTSVISDCTITGVNTGIELRAGSLTVEDCIINGNADPASFAANGNGSTVNGAALAVSQHSTDYTVSLTVDGGTYTGVYAVYEKDLQNSTATDKISMSLKSGSFDGLVYSQNCTGFITGGIYNNNPDDTYIAQGYEKESNTPSSNHWTVSFNEKHVGTGTINDPFLIYDREDFQAITDNYATYYYYKIASSYTETDLTNWVPVKLHGSFDGNGVTFTNVTSSLFNTVGYNLANEEITLKNFTVEMNISVPQEYGAAAVVKNIFNAGTTTFSNVDVHGKIEGYWNIGSYYNYGTANYDDKGCDYTVEFIDCHSDAALICTSGNTCGGLLGHAYEGSGNSVTIKIDSETEYTGTIYTTNGTGGKYFAMTSDYYNTKNHFIFDGTEDTFDNGSAKNAYSNCVTIECVAPTGSAEDGFKVAKSESVVKAVVSVNAQLSGYESNNTTPIANLSGITFTLKSDILTSFDSDTVLLGAFSGTEIVNGADEYNAEIKNGKLVLSIAQEGANYRSGTVRLTVTQYDSENNVVSCGTVNVVEIANAK